MRLVAALAFAALAAACGGYDGPKEGHVSAKHYDDPDRWLQCLPTGTPGKPGYNSCGMQLWQTDPARWSLTIEADDKSGDFDVDETTYHAVEVGDWFNTETGEVEPR